MAKSERIKVECLECGKKFTVGAKNTDPECPKCGGVDIDVREDFVNALKPKPSAMGTCGRCGGRFPTRTSGVDAGVRLCVSAATCEANIATKGR